MSHRNPVHSRSADHGMCGMGAAWLGAGGLIGLIVVDSNRPAVGASAGAGIASALPMQFAAAH